MAQVIYGFDRQEVISPAKTKLADEILAVWNSSRIPTRTALGHFLRDESLNQDQKTSIIRAFMERFKAQEGLPASEIDKPNLVYLALMQKVAEGWGRPQPAIDPLWEVKNPVPQDSLKRFLDDITITLSSFATCAPARVESVSPYTKTASGLDSLTHSLIPFLISSILSGRVK